MSATTAWAEGVLPFERARVWSLVADPGQHHRFDATGMVGGLASRAPKAAGDVFRMNMTYSGDGATEHYQTDNHVIRYQAGEAIVWATALPGGEPLGWTWSYELHDDPRGTRVRLTYDWTDTPAENVVRFGVPLTDGLGLVAALELLAQACESS